MSFLSLFSSYSSVSFLHVEYEQNQSNRMASQNLFLFFIFSLSINRKRYASPSIQIIVRSQTDITESHIQTNTSRKPIRYVVSTCHQPCLLDRNRKRTQTLKKKKISFVPVVNHIGAQSSVVCLPVLLVHGN